jgi:hypothetical protein
MNRHRTIIALCLTAAACLLAASGAMMPRLNALRVQQQLVANIEAMKNLPPELAFVQLLSSFRGLAVDVLWTRTGKLKDQGKYYEAMQLAEWITTLQPRFPQVWAFQAWNMAYNISVATTTPAERWMWVHAGVRLLRDRGIPQNPTSVLLHKELAWIYLNKIGGYTDEMHLYYKQRLAADWHAILGAPPEQGPESVVAAFEPIAQAYDDYLNDAEPGRDLRLELERQAASTRSYARELREMGYLSIEPLAVRLEALRARLDADDARALAPLQQQVDRQMASRHLDPVDRLLAARPDLRPHVQAMRTWGLTLDETWLGRVAFLNARRSGEVRLLGMKLPELVEEADRKLDAWLLDEKIEPQRRLLTDFVRAKVIRQKQGLDPLWMLELMRGKWLAPIGGEPVLAPLDWRHPASHGLYWASMGVRRSKGILRPEDFDVLNTDRHALHALQLLAENGKIIFDPVTTAYYRQLPHADFIAPYESAMFGAKDRLSTRQRAETDSPLSFDAGHENFLVRAVQTAYFFGSQRQAQGLYQRLRELYMGLGEGRERRFTRPLEEFVVAEMIRNDSVTSPDEARAFVAGLIFRAVETGLSTGQAATADRFLAMAAQFHRQYQAGQEAAARNAPEGRMHLPPMDDMVADVFTRFLTYPTGNAQGLLVKARAWKEAPAALRARVYPKVSAALNAEAERYRLDAAAAFPAPAPPHPSPGSPPAPPPASTPGRELKSRDVIK